MEENEVIKSVIEKLQNEKPTSEYGNLVIQEAIKNLKEQVYGREI
jgi:hypothetical protein